MQQIAYMGYQATQQTVMTPMAPVLFANSVLPMVPGSNYNHWHVTREDFQQITEDGADADFLRDLENQTNYLRGKLYKDGLVPEGYLPASEDLWIVSTPQKAVERTLHAWGHTKYWEAIPRLIKKGFVKRRFAAPLLSSIFEEDPATTIFLGLLDGQAYIVVDDAEGNYQGVDGEVHNAVEDGHTQAWMIRREYLLCIEKIQAAQYALVFLDPPEPAKRWPPVTRRREPKKNSASAPTDCDPNGASDATNNQLSSQPSAQGGTLNADVCQESGYLHDTVDSNIMSTVRREFSTNVLPISSDSQVAGLYQNAPWSLETLVGLAQARHTPGFFEIGKDDEDYEGAEKLEGLRLSLGLDPVRFWTLVDQHIMAMMHGQTWYATKRTGRIKRFSLVHVANQWYTVEGELRRHPYSPLDPVIYEGPLDDYEEPHCPPAPVEADYPAEEATQEDPPAEVPRPRIVSGTLRSYAETLLYRILNEHPLLQAYLVNLAPNKYIVRIETPGGFVDLDRPSEWSAPPPEIKDLIEQAVAAQRGGDGYGYRGLAYDQAWHDPGGMRQSDHRDYVGASIDHL